jgi:C_GCAxxG_C_C family probable redox protein
MERTVQEGIEHATMCWTSQFNCAESVLRGVCHAEDQELPDASKKMATPFGGGIGRSEDVCGALAGGVLGIGACIGRTSPTEDKMESYEAAGRLHRQFGETLGETSCKALNKGDFKSPQHRVRCGRIVQEATRLTLEILRQS